MFNNRLQYRNGGHGGGKDYSNDDDPPMSRLFIICNKSHTEEDFREAFSPFGEIKDIWIVKDKIKQENKGIAYITFAKTSEAAKAQEEMNGKVVGNVDGSVKVLVAANPNQVINKHENDHEKYVRLFIVCSKDVCEKELFEEFNKYGNVESITIVKDKLTGISKGCAYVRYSKFYYAALALESCPTKYKAIFAEPKSFLRTQRDSFDRANNDNTGFNSNNMSKNNFTNINYNSYKNIKCNNEMSEFLGMQYLPVTQPTCLEVIVSNLVNQDQLWRLFDIVPGLDTCQIIREYQPKSIEAKVVYNNPKSAAYAKNKLHGLEYPIGERIIVKETGMQNLYKETSFINRNTRNDSLTNISLPPMQAMASPDDPVAQRLFIVLARNIPLVILKNVFSCWKGLIDVYLLPNKNCGYVKYAKMKSAQKAIQVLNGAEICGIKIKVIEAEERINDYSRRKRLRSY